jgi:hypothetical protein
MGLRAWVMGMVDVFDVRAYSVAYHYAGVVGVSDFVRYMSIVFVLCVWIVRSELPFKVSITTIIELPGGNIGFEVSVGA